VISACVVTLTGVAQLDCAPEHGECLVVITRRAEDARAG
jgi:hypothetical protein